MRVLGIETATTICAAAVVSDGRVLSEASVSEKYVHAERLMQQVDAVLRQAQYSLMQLDAIAISIGPGSFTGLRIGLSVAKGLSHAVDKCLVPVPTLFGLAQRVVDEQVARRGEYILAALDARRDAVYCQFFEVMDGRVLPLAEPRDLPVKNVATEMPAQKTWVTGDASIKLRSALSGSGSLWDLVPGRVAHCSAGTVGLLGESLMKKGEAAGAASLEPLYIKEFFVKQPAST